VDWTVEKGISCVVVSGYLFTLKQGLDPKEAALPVFKGVAQHLSNSKGR
jgi:hypothetical protein